MSKQRKPGNHCFDNDFLDLTETEESSSTSTNDEVFATRKPFVLELYEITKDDPPLTNQSPEVKLKKLKKKKKQRNKTHGSESSDSLSESSSALDPTSVEAVKEEFYDAHQSFHVLPESQVSNSMASAALALVHSEHGENPKEPEAGPTAKHTPSASIAQSEPSSTVSKPVIKPD